MEKKIGCEFNKRPQLHKGYEDSLRQSRVITLFFYDYDSYTQLTTE